MPNFLEEYARKKLYGQRPNNTWNKTIDQALPFNPEGNAYDYSTASGQGKDPETQHFPSLDARTGMLLKGINHPSIDKTIQAEKELNNEVVKKNDRYYSQPSMQDYATTQLGNIAQSETQRINKEAPLNLPRQPKPLGNINITNQPSGLADKDLWEKAEQEAERKRQEQERIQKLAQENPAQLWDETRKKEYEDIKKQQINNVLDVASSLHKVSSQASSKLAGGAKFIQEYAKAHINASPVSEETKKSINEPIDKYVGGVREYFKNNAESLNKVNERIEKMANPTINRKLAKSAMEMGLSLPQYAIEQLAGGPMVGFALGSGLESYGKDEPPEQIASNAINAGATGLLFKGVGGTVNPYKRAGILGSGMATQAAIQGGSIEDIGEAFVGGSILGLSSGGLTEPPWPAAR